jgi:hypothetical protein
MSFQIPQNQLSTFVDDYESITQGDFNVYPNTANNMFTVSWETTKARLSLSRVQKA